jgi:hypothetical protein
MLQLTAELTPKNRQKPINNPKKPKKTCISQIPAVPLHLFQQPNYFKTTMKTTLFILLSLWQTGNSEFKLQAGDLIFQESCSGDMGAAIKEVTTSLDAYSFTHVGIVYVDEKDSIFVIEATHPKVVQTPIYQYLYPKNGKGCYPVSVVGRLKKQYQPCIPRALNEALLLIGKEYDDGFVLGDDKYYCSELLYEIFVKANGGKAVFPLNVMTFKSPETGKTAEGWVEHFSKHNLPVPEGELGINPGAMSRAEVIDIVCKLSTNYTN